MGCAVTSIDKSSKKIKLNDGTEISYDKLLLATGGRARVPSAPGIDLKNVHVLRTASDQTRIKEAAKDAKNVVVVGGGGACDIAVLGFLLALCLAIPPTTELGKAAVPVKIT